METAQIALHETSDLTIEDVLEADPNHLKLRLKGRIYETQKPYFRFASQGGVLRINLKSRLARLGFNLAIEENSKPVLDGEEVYCDVTLVHHMEQYRQGFDPLELIVRHYESGKDSGNGVKIAKVIGYFQEEVLTSKQIGRGIWEGKIIPLVPHRVEGEVLYLALDNGIFVPNESYGADAARDILMEDNGRSRIDRLTRSISVEGIIAKNGFGPITGTSINPGGFEVDILDPNINGVSHSEARFLSYDHTGYVHLEFCGHNGGQKISEIGVKLIRPQFREALPR